MKKWNLLLVLVLSLTMVLAFTGCSDDDDDDGTVTPTVTFEEDLAGEWFSVGTGIPATISTYYDSVYATFTAEGTVTLETHLIGSIWTTSNGTYSVTESEDIDIHAIHIIYPEYEQEGIIQIVDGTPDQMKLEVVPNTGAFTIPSPEAGFNETGGNIQVYTRE